MTFFSSISAGYSLSGFAVGFLVGLTGVGGGSLMTPILVLLFGIHPATAVGTDLLFASVTKSVGSMVHGFNETVDWRITRRLAMGSVPATAVTLVALHYLGPAGGGSLISTVLGIALIVTALTLVFRKTIVAFAARHLGEADPRRTRILTIITGAVLGTVVSLSSVGAGAIGVTALILLYPRLPTARIIGSDIAHAVPLTLVAGLGHWLLGSVDWLLLNALLLGSVPGIIVGSLVSARVPDTVLRPILAATLVVVGSKLAL
jgi:uncharacterized membrane protein YfcA